MSRWIIALCLAVLPAGTGGCGVIEDGRDASADAAPDAEDEGGGEVLVGTCGAVPGRTATLPWVAGVLDLR